MSHAPHPPGQPDRTKRATRGPHSQSSPSAGSVWRFAHGAGALLVKRHPDLLTQEFIKADRGDRIFVDTGRNGPGATCAAVYAVRPKEGAPVSAPCTCEAHSSSAAVFVPPFLPDGFSGFDDPSVLARRQQAG